MAPRTARQRPLRDPAVALEAARAAYVRSLRRAEERAKTLAQTARAVPGDSRSTDGRTVAEIAAEWARYSAWLLEEAMAMPSSVAKAEGIES